MHTNDQLILNRLVESFLSQSPDKSQRLYLRLYNHIKVAIANLDIPEQFTLPSTRALATALGVSRSTVIKAYDLLRLEGYIVAKAGSGYKTVAREQERSPKKKGNHTQYPNISATGVSFLNNVSLMNSTSDKSIAFRPGLPPLDIFPVNQWKNLTNLYWRHIRASALSYSPSSGIESLKRNIAGYLNITRGIKCDYRQVIIVSGSLQSLYLIGNVLINKNEWVAMENPTFPNVHSIFKSLQAQIHTIDVDEQGLNVARLPVGSKRIPKLVHTTPSSHYPTGVRMSMQRRSELLAWANKHQALVIENDYEHEVCNWNKPIPSLFSLDKEDRVIFMGTFNRLLHPSIRLGYMVVPFYLLDAVEALQKHSHRFVSPSTQIVMNQFIEKKHLYNHVKRVVQVAEERKEVFVKTFDECFQGKIQIQKRDSDSLFLMAGQGEMDDKLVTEVLERNNIVTHAYSKCFITQNQDNGLILGHTSVRKPVIIKTLAKMARILNEHFGKRDSYFGLLKK